MSIVWPCSLSVEVYAEAGREVEVPRPDCPACSGPMVFWSGYQRYVRAGGLCRRLFVARARCVPCEVTHALLPSFLLEGRLDVVETIGAVIGSVGLGRSGVRPPAERLEVPHSTARDWCRRFRAVAAQAAVGFAALAVELGGDPPPARSGSARQAMAAIGEAWHAAVGLAGWALLGMWRFVSAVSGGQLIGINTNPLWLIVGRRRFMPPVL